MIQQIKNTLEENGFAIIPSVFAENEISELISVVNPMLKNCPAAGIRGISQKLPTIQALSSSLKILDLVTPILGNEARLVRSILFNKNPKVNWKVTWHQDLSIAVAKKVKVEGFNSWSVKEGIVHVQPPESILEKMLIVRIHLDAADESNGALWVSPRSHHFGRISTTQAGSVARKNGEFLCSVQAGDVLLFRPLLLHSSHKVSSFSNRRIVHLEFSSAKLPDLLEWNL
jgi:ectoine hydroxylase-related dioxygenase (phytanoyl-CoA dioxygenase family)